MNRWLVLSGVGAAMLASGSGIAGSYAGSYVDSAQVVDVQPIVRTVRVETPHRECWEEEVHQAERPRASDIIVGGVIGGVVGNAVGRHINHGRGRNAATVLGTLIGAAVGHDRAAADSHGGEVCRTYTDYRVEERTEGYWVTYRYRGQEFRTRMAHDPGERLSVRVHVTPLAD